MSLRQLWTSAAKGRMAPKEQCKLWALREVLRAQGADSTQFEWMSQQVTVVGGGSPGRDAVRRFFQRVDDAGDDWHPGYTAGRRGRRPEMTPRKRRMLAVSMMAAKKRGVMPCYETALALAPRASFNDATNAPFSRQTINEVLTTSCYDKDPSKPWEFRYGSKRRALLEEDKATRLDLREFVS